MYFLFPAKEFDDLVVEFMILKFWNLNTEKIRISLLDAGA